MKGDFTKLLSQSKLEEKKYTGVYMQQGRLQLDSDWNTQVEIYKRFIQTYTQDLIGGADNPGSGVPDKGEEQTNSQEVSGPGKNFLISRIPNEKDFKIAPGRIYVHGILCECLNEDGDLLYSEQEDHPNALAIDLNGEGLQAGTKYVAYLDVWERHLTVLDDPAIGEVALNGLDSTTRTKLVWQVRLMEESQWNSFFENYKKYNRRKVSITATTTGKQPQENRLYRIEIHQGGPKEKAEIKWSRDNGSVAFSVSEIKDNIITVNSRGHTISQSLKPGDWVEIISEDQEKNNQSGTFVKLSSVVETPSKGRQLVVGNTLNGEPVTPKSYRFSNETADNNLAAKIKVRRWDFDSNQPDTPLLPIDQEINLDSLIRVKFNDTEFEYQTGDYWVLPVRLNEPFPEWHEELLEANGIDHHYLRLASSTSDGEKFEDWKDERIAFPSLSNCISQQAELENLKGLNLNQLSIGTPDKLATLEVRDTGTDRNEGVKIRSYPGDEPQRILQLYDDTSTTRSSVPPKELTVGTVITVNGQTTTIKEVNPEGVDQAYRVDPPLETILEEPADYSFKPPIARFRSREDTTKEVIITAQGKIKADSLELAPTGEFKTGSFIGNQLQLQGDLNNLSDEPYGFLQAIDSQLRFTATGVGVNFAFLNGDVSISKENEEKANLTVEGQIKADSLLLPPTADFEAGRFIGQAFLFQRLQPDQSNVSFGAAQIYPLDGGDSQEIRFTAEPGINFAFLGGNVRIENSGDTSATLAIQGHVLFHIPATKPGRNDHRIFQHLRLGRRTKSRKLLYRRLRQSMTEKPISMAVLKCHLIRNA
jgi:hypothetical protein